MNSETKTCQNCKTDFEIAPEDFTFYKKIGVPAPTLCPECRAQLRLLHRNERNLYQRTCDKTGEKIISVFSPDKPYVVWGYETWFSDDWDPLDYGIDYDPSVSFFEQYRTLQQKVPKPALIYVNSVNSPYVHLSADNKNCYMIFESSNNQDCTYCYWIQQCTQCVGVSFSHQCELCFECDDCYSCYKTQESRSCHDCSGCIFCVDCRGCTDCIGCVNQHQKQYCIFNEQYSKEEYYKKKTELALDTYTGREAFRVQFKEFLTTQPHKYAHMVNAPGCTGDYIKSAKNCQYCFHCYEAEDNKYGEHVWRNAKDCYDVSTAGRGASFIYNGINTGLNTAHCIGVNVAWSCTYTNYSQYCFNTNNCFGCFGLRKKEYCILNKQYNKEEYEKITRQIIEQMKRESVYGDFFPVELSFFGYNETVAQEQFPLTKEQAVDRGYYWSENVRGTYGAETKNWNDVPERISDIDFDIMQEVFTCQETQKNYRCIEQEKQVYKQLDVPLPRIHPDVRHEKRMIARGENKLYKRTTEDGVEVMTPYAPDRPEKIYSEKGYQDLIM